MRNLSRRHVFLRTDHRCRTLFLKYRVPANTTSTANIHPICLDNDRGNVVMSYGWVP